jgi:hypothetical protein
MASILFAFAFIPQVVLFVGQMLVSEDGALRYLRENAEILWQVPVAVALLALYYSVVGVAIASMTSRRIIAGATFVGLLLVSSIISGVLVGEDPAGESNAALINLAGLPLVVRDLVFLGEVGDDHGLSGVANGGLFAVAAFAAVVVASLVALGIRYDEVER